MNFVKIVILDKSLILFTNRLPSLIPYKARFRDPSDLKRPWIFINLKFKNTKMKIDLKFNKNTKKKMKYGLEKVSY